MKNEKLLYRSLLGIELDLDIIVLIVLWYFNYKITFWVFLILFFINAQIRVNRINNI